MLRYEAYADVDPAEVWSLIARPDRWHEWSPHVRGAWGLGTPEVRQGARGAVRLLGVAPVPAKVTDVQPGRCWTWRVGLIRVSHRVDRRAGQSSTVGIDLSAPWPLESILRRSYGPWCQRAVTAIARVAVAGHGPPAVTAG